MLFFLSTTAVPAVATFYACRTLLGLGEERKADSALVARQILETRVLVFVQTPRDRRHHPRAVARVAVAAARAAVLFGGQRVRCASA